MDITKWSGVAISMESAKAAAGTITGITKANPGVVSETAHGYSDGDYVLLTIQGMHQLDQVVARVSNKTADTYELEGINTTLFDTFTSGTDEKLTLGTSVTTATTITASGGDFGFIDATTIHDNTKKQVPGLANPSTFTFENIWDPAEAGYIAMKYASDNQLQKSFLFSFANGKKMAFAGYVGASGIPTGGAQDIVKTPSVITMFGKPTTYAS